MRSFMLSLILSTALFCTVAAQTTNGTNIDNSLKKRLLIMPINALGIDSISVKTAAFLLLQELRKLNVYSLDNSSQSCEDTPCAVKAAKDKNADLVLLSYVSRLGEKVVIQYTMIDASTGREVLIDNTTSETVEDLEKVMKRIAISVSTNRPISSGAQVGTIMQSESHENVKRGAEGFIGFNFGYLYPTSGFDDDDRSFTFDLRTGYEMENTAVGFHIAARKGIALNLFTSYLMSKTDVCPYFGGGVGFHWVNHSEPVVTRINYNYDSDPEDKKDDGPELILNAGLRLFRTYKFEILMNFDYAMTFNDYNDKSLIFTLGLLH